MSNKIKVLLVDDSSLARKMVRKLLDSEPMIEVVAEAHDGASALDKVRAMDIDVAILDFEMPVMNGLEFLKAMKADDSITIKPEVLIFSSQTKSGSKQTIDCLLNGAKDYILKPEAGSDLGELGKQIVKQVKSFAEIHLKKKRRIQRAQQHLRTTTEGSGRAGVTTVTREPVKSNNVSTVSLKNPGLVVIASSTGGPAALEVVLKTLPQDFSYPVLIVQHMPANFTASLVESLRKNVKLEVHEVTGEIKIQRGHIYVAGGGKHTYMKDKETLDVRDGELVSFCKPAADVLFETVAEQYHKSVLAVVLTGMGHDGAAGITKLKNNLDCFCVIQDEESSVVWGMPGAVYQRNLQDIVAPLERIGDLIISAKYTAAARGHS